MNFANYGSRLTWRALVGPGVHYLPWPSMPTAIQSAYNAWHCLNEARTMLDQHRPDITDEPEMLAAYEVDAKGGPFCDGCPAEGYDPIWEKLKADLQILIDKQDSITRKTTDNIEHSRSAGRYSAFCHVQRIMDLYQHGRVRML